MAELTLTEESATPKWRVFTGQDDVAPGTSKGSGDHLVWSISPGEWTLCGARPQGEVVDLTHVRSAFRLTGEHASEVINRVCSLDLTDDMFPSGAAARSLFAGVATEIVRDDQNGIPSYVLVPSRSFNRYVRDVILDAGDEFGLTL